MYLANGQFTKVGSYPTILRSHANLVFPDPDAALGRFLDSELNALVNHRAGSRHSNATEAMGAIRAEESLVGDGNAAISKPPAWLFGISPAIGLIRSAD
jgi:hypothetical protein